MFGWFKRNSNYLVPKDVKLGLMTSFFCTAKLDEKIIIPENVRCYVHYKDKQYAELQPGEYELTREFLFDLYKKQLKRNNKIKKLKLDLYFINLDPVNIDVDYYDKIFISNALQKILFSAIVTTKINRNKSFKNFMIGEHAEIKGDYSNKLVAGYVQEFLHKYFLRKKIENYTLPEEKLDKIKAKLNDYLSHIGLIVTDLKLTLGGKIKPELKPTGEFDFFETDLKNIDNQPKDVLKFEAQPIQQTENVLDCSVCPNCQSKRVENATFCHICGYSFFKEKL